MVVHHISWMFLNGMTLPAQTRLVEWEQLEFAGDNMVQDPGGAWDDVTPSVLTKKV